MLSTPKCLTMTTLHTREGTSFSAAIVPRASTIIQLTFTSPIPARLYTQVRDTKKRCDFAIIRLEQDVFFHRQGISEVLVRPSKYAWKLHENATLWHPHSCHFILS